MKLKRHATIKLNESEITQQDATNVVKKYPEIIRRIKSLVGLLDSKLANGITLHQSEKFEITGSEDFKDYWHDELKDATFAIAFNDVNMEWIEFSDILIFNDELKKYKLEIDAISPYGIMIKAPIEDFK